MMELTDKLGWLADKIPAFGDYGKDCANTMRRAADEIAKLRDELAAAEVAMRSIRSQLQSSDHSHKCIRCFHEYTPAFDAETEDCPKCGCDGTDKEK